MGEGDPGCQYQGGVRACGNALARSFALTKPKDSTAPERQSTDYPGSGSPARCVRSALSRCSRNSRSVVSTRSTRISWSTAARSMGCRFSMAASRVRQASRAPSESLEAMRPSPSPNLRRMPQTRVRWVKRAGRTGIGRLSSSRVARSPDFARAMPTAFCGRSGRRCCKSPVEEASFLADCAREGAKAVLTAHAERTEAQAFNVVASVSGSNSGAAPLVVMTPRSGWWSCASERGGGLVCWLEIMRAVRDARPVRDVLFVASSGHELGHLGLDSFIERRPGLVPAAKGLDSSRRQYRRSAGARQYPAGLRRRDGIDDGRGDDQGWAADRPAPSARRGATRRSPKHSPRRRAVHFDHRKERSLSQS